MPHPKVTLKDLALLLKEAKRQEKADAVMVRRLQKRIATQKKKQKLNKKLDKAVGTLPKDAK